MSKQTQACDTTCNAGTVVKDVPLITNEQECSLRKGDKINLRIFEGRYNDTIDALVHILESIQAKDDTQGYFLQVIQQEGVGAYTAQIKV